MIYYGQSMDSNTPYQSPHSHMSPQPPADIPDVMVREPGEVKTFGVLHLVIAGLGIVMNSFSLLSTIFFKSIASNLSNPGGVSNPSVPNQEAVMMNYMSEMATYTYLAIAMNAVLIVMLIIAGIGLLKVREKGRVMSVRYAWTSLAMKLVIVIYTIVAVIPATKRYTDTIYQGMPAGLGNTMGSMMQYGQILTILFYCIYPIFVLVVMRGQKVRGFLAGR